MDECVLYLASKSHAVSQFIVMIIITVISTTSVGREELLNGLV